MNLELVNVSDTVSDIISLIPYSDSSGTYVVCGCGRSTYAMDEIKILDVTVPSSPELLDWYYVPEPIYDSYYIMRHGLASFDVKYPYLFTFETIQAWDTSGGDGYYLFGWIQVKKFDLRDLSAPPIVWRTDEEPIDYEAGIMFWGGIASDSGVFFSFEPFYTHWRNYFLSYNDSTLNTSCELTDILYLPRYAVGDTYYVKTYPASVIAIKLTESCAIDTLGYYSFGTEIGGRTVVDGRYIYIVSVSKIYIFSWIPDQIGEHGYLEKKEDYRVYPSPIIFGSKLVLNRPLNKASGIYDISGKLVKNIPKNRMRISTENFSPGLYFLISDDKKVKIKFIVLE